MPVKCMACESVSHAQDTYSSQENHDRHGIHWIVRDRDQIYD